MASCGGGGGACYQSHCRRQEEDGNTEEKQEADSLCGNSHGSTAAQGGKLARCTKCGEDTAAVKEAATRVLNGMCTECFRAYLFGKFKLAVTTNAMISPSDKVLIAFSGGPASRVVLQFVHEMQRKSFESWDASKSQALPVFGMGVAFIDESVISVDSSSDMNRTMEKIRSIISTLYPAEKELHIASIEDICSIGSDDGRTRLKFLFDSVPDATGKEDFLEYLRMLSLQQIALNNGYSKIVLGSCTSTIACHVISATVKDNISFTSVSEAYLSIFASVLAGQGYSLPADVQYVDARREVPVVLPLRDCLAEELSMLCHLDNLEMLQLPKGPSNSINSLVSSFVARLRDENPSRERTIVRTAEKLRPFSFNKFLENKYHEFLPSRLRCKFQNANINDSAPSEVLCKLCASPLSESELQSLRNIEESSRTLVTLRCCQSCSFQIVPKDAISCQLFYANLPQSMAQSMRGSTLGHSSLRELIDDYLLDEDDDNIGT